MLNLSELIFKDESGVEVIATDNVREFIRRLKFGRDEKDKLSIDQQAGNKLI